MDDRRVVIDERPHTVPAWKRWRRDRTNQVASQPLDSVTHAVGPAIDETARAYGTAHQLCNTGATRAYTRHVRLVGWRAAAEVGAGRDHKIASSHEKSSSACCATAIASG